MPNTKAMRVAGYVGFVRESEAQLARALDRVADHHGEESEDEPDRLVHDLFRGPRQGPLALMRDLQDLYPLASEVDVCRTVLAQAASALRDEDLAGACAGAKGQTKRQLAWLTTRIKQAAPQALVVA